MKQIQKQRNPILNLQKKKYSGKYFRRKQKSNPKGSRPTFYIKREKKSWRETRGEKKEKNR